MSTDSQNECQTKFEVWARKEGSYDLAKDHDGDYQSPDTWELYRGWEACWDLKAQKIEDMENAMIAMSDSLGILAMSEISEAAQQIYDKWMSQGPTEAESICALAHRCFAAGVASTEREIGCDLLPNSDLESLDYYLWKRAAYDGPPPVSGEYEIRLKDGQVTHAFYNADCAVFGIGDGEVHLNKVEWREIFPASPVQRAARLYLAQARKRNSIEGGQS